MCLMVHYMRGGWVLAVVPFTSMMPGMVEAHILSVVSDHSKYFVIFFLIQQTCNFESSTILSCLNYRLRDPMSTMVDVVCGICGVHHVHCAWP